MHRPYEVHRNLHRPSAAISRPRVCDGRAIDPYKVHPKFLPHPDGCTKIAPPRGAEGQFLF